MCGELDGFCLHYGVLYSHFNEVGVTHSHFSEPAAICPRSDELDLVYSGAGDEQILFGIRASQAVGDVFLLPFTALTEWDSPVPA